MAEAEIVHVLTRMFPSFRGVPPDEAGRRGDALGCFCARAWAGGLQALQSRGMPVTPEAHAGLLGMAAQVAQAQRGGLTFLAHLRSSLNEDARFAQVLKGLAQAYAESLRGGPAPAPAPTLAAAPAAPSGGGLDLLPEQPTPARAAAFGLDLAPEQPAPARAAAFDLTAEPAPAPSGLGLAGAPGGEGIDLEGSGTASRAAAMEFLYSAVESSDPDSDEGSAIPTDPSERAFFSFERSGDERFLAEAEQALRGDLQSAPHAMAAGMAEAGLGKVALLRGDRETAERLARSAQGRFPANPLAVEVLVRAGRGEAEEAGFLKGLRQLALALASRDVSHIGELAQRMAQAYPTEPFAYLAMFFVAHMQENKAAKERYLKEAWTCYPSTDHAQRCFGGEVDPDVIDALLYYGRRAINTYDEVLLRQTIENIDAKDNLIAGSLRMAVGLGRVALTQSGVPRPIQRRLHFGVGKGLMGLQYFELAPEAMGRALMIAPTPDEHKAISKERVQCQALWRAFDKPGIKAQQKKYPCPGVKAMTELLKRELETVRAERQQREQELYSKAPLLVERVEQDPSIAREIAAAADVNSMPDPLSAVRAIDHELDALARAQAEEAGDKKEKSKGLFGRLKDVANTAASAAKGAATKLKESQLRSKRDEAVKHLAVCLARDLRDHEFKNPLLMGYARQAAVLEAYVDYYEAEDKRARKRLTKLGNAV